MLKVSLNVVLIEVKQNEGEVDIEDEYQKQVVVVEPNGEEPPGESGISTEILKYSLC